MTAQEKLDLLLEALHKAEERQEAIPLCITDAWEAISFADMEDWGK